MVKVTLEEESKTIENECECAFVCLMKPVRAPEGSNAVMCLGGEGSIINMARAIGVCALKAIEAMAEGDEGAKDAGVYELLREIGKDYDEYE
jgi:hypothetical protein